MKSSAVIITCLASLIAAGPLRQLQHGSEDDLRARVHQMVDKYIDDGLGYDDYDDESNRYPRANHFVMHGHSDHGRRPERHLGDWVEDVDVDERTTIYQDVARYGDDASVVEDRVYSEERYSRTEYRDDLREDGYDDEWDECDEWEEWDGWYVGYGDELLREENECDDGQLVDSFPADRCADCGLWEEGPDARAPDDTDTAIDAVQPNMMRQELR